MLGELGAIQQYNIYSKTATFFEKSGDFKYLRLAAALAAWYNSKIHTYKPYYKPYTVIEEWQSYANFREWFRQNNIEG